MQVTILGGGLSGLITAISLAHYKITSIIIEKSTYSQKDFTCDGRTIALSKHSKEYLEQIGVWNQIKNYACPITDILVGDNFSKAELHFPYRLADLEPMGYIIKNTNFKEELYDIARNNSFINMQAGVTYTGFKTEPSYIETFLDKGYSVKSELVVIADGRNSIAYKENFTDRFFKNYHQTALVFNVSHANSNEGYAVEHFLPGGPFATLPLSSHESSIVWTLPTNKAIAYQAISTEDMTYFIEEKFPYFLGKPRIISEVQAYPLIARHAKSYINNRFVLVADSAHVLHPLAGQGLNQGILDIETFTRCIAESEILGLTLASSVYLKRYEQERYSDNNAMFEITDNINSLFASDNKVLSKLRQIGLSFVNDNSILKSFFMNYAMGKSRLRAS